MAQQTAQTLAHSQKAASALGLEIEAEMFFFIVIKQQMGESAINVVLCERHMALKPNPTPLTCKLQAAFSLSN